MNNRWQKTIATAMLAANVFACQKPHQASSSLFWAHMPYQGQGGNWLIDVPPNSVIEVCGDSKPTTDLLKAAILKWASVIGRDKFLKVVDCHTDAAAKLKVQFRTADCVGVALANPTAATLVKCRDYATVAENLVVFHETGHLWGLCDLYQGGYAYCDQDPKNNSGVPTEDAAMLSGKSTEPLKDDREGIKALAERSDIPANKIWQAFLAQQAQEPAADERLPPASQGTDADLFLAIKDIADDIVRFYISSLAPVKKVAMCLAPKYICTAPGVTAVESITFSPSATTDGRAIFVSEQKVQIASGQIYTLLSWDDENHLKSAVEVEFRKR